MSFKIAEANFFSNIPDVPPEYLGEDGKPPLSHINGAEFKAQWDSGKVRDWDPVVKSREQGVKYTLKKTLRKRLMEFVALKNIAVAKAKRKSAWLSP